MPQYTLNVPAGVAQRTADAFVGVYGYQATVADPANPGQTIPNPEGVPAFIKRKLSEHIKDVIKTWEASAAGQAATAAAVAKVDTEIVIT